jgi:type IV secretion system protein VirB2
MINMRDGKTILGGALLTPFTAAAAAAQVIDPAGSGAITGALGWMEGTLMGTVATVAAVIAIASVGFMMLTGRMNWRHGITVIIGCFILFGAASIVAGIRQTAAGF